MQRNGFRLHRRTSLCQKLPADFKEKLVAFQRSVTRLQKKNNCLLSQTGDANEIPVYSDMPSNYTVDEEAKSVAIKTLGYEKMCVTVMLVVPVDGSKLPHYTSLNCKTMPKEQLPRGIIARCQPKVWMVNDLMKYLLLLV